MEALPVHIAVLSIADSAASADRETSRAIGEKAAAAGHEIVDEEIVRDDEAAIRDQLVRWISTDNIDVVIVTASMDSEMASAALAPLIKNQLPGFTDLFRWLTFQEIGASAMQSTAEAVQCQDTFVFVLPAHAGAVGAAMDKLILPQLDARTKPKNLVTQMPRLKDAAKKIVPDRSMPVFAAPAAARPDTQPEPDAVPHHVEPAKEKTQGGPGLQPKRPAQPTPGQQPRGKPRTANTIARKTDDPPTKPIDLAKLEKQIKLSTQHDAHTKQIDLKANDAKTKVVDMSAHQAKTRVVDSRGVLPRVPPGADDDGWSEDDAEGLTFSTPARPNPATQALPGAVRSPAPVGISKPPPALSTPSFSTPVARSTPPQGRQAVATPPPTPVVKPPPTPRGAAPIALTRDMAITPVKPTPVVQPGRTPPIALTRDMAITPVKPTPVTQQAVPPQRDTAMSMSPPPPVLISPSRRPPTDDEVRTGRGAQKRPQITNPEEEEATTEAATLRAAMADEAPTTRAPSTPVAAAEPQRPAQAPNAAELWARAIAPITTPAPQPVVAAREPEPEPEPPAPMPVSNLFAPQPRKPAPTPSPVDPLAAVTQKPIGVGDLPEGDFVYPIKRAGLPLYVKLLAAIALLAAGFVAFVALYPRDEDQPTQTAALTPTPPPTPPTPTPTPAPSEPVATPPEPTPAPVEQKPEPIEVDPAPTPAPTPPPTTKPTGKKTKPKPTGEGATPKPPLETTEPKPKPETKPEVVADPGCDEVGCVLSKYDRPCCERFKPQDSFTPKNVVPDELDRSAVKAGVERIKPRVVACGEKSGTKGTVRLAVTVDGEGTVKSVSVTESPEPSLGDCVASAMRGAKFAKSVNGGEFNYPFVF